MSKPIFRDARRPIQVLMVCVSTIAFTLFSQVSAQEVLPRPEAPFGGKIGLTYKDSEAVKPKLKIPATFGLENPPNILIVLIDDCGFGQMSTFGGGIPTPTLDRIANNGLKYTRFHTTALCSPTRAALLTGRNHHSVGSGVIGEAGNRVSRLLGDHSRLRGNICGSLARVRLRQRLVWKKSQRSRLGDQPGWPL